MSDQIGSVRNVTWSICTSSVAWPIQVTVGLLCRAFSRRKAPSFGTRPGAPWRSLNQPPKRRMKNGQRTLALPCQSAPL